MDDGMIPKANPRSPETRLLRAIYGLCPDHDECTPADHPDEAEAAHRITGVRGEEP